MHCNCSNHKFTKYTQHDISNINPEFNSLQVGNDFKINRPKVLNERKYEQLSFYHGRSKSSVVIVFQSVETW